MANVMRNRTGASIGIRGARPFLIFVIAVSVFAGTLRYELVWDDPLLTTLVEERVQAEGVTSLLTSDFRLRRHQPMGYYRPLVLLSLWADSRLPLPAPAAHHLQSVLLHALASVLVYSLLTLLVASPDGAFIGAALFAVHPVHTESVAFISGRTDVLCAVFVFISAIFWLRARSLVTVRPALDTGLSVGAFFLACLSKEVAFALPLVLLAWDLFDVRPGGRGAASWIRRNRRWLLGWSVALGSTFGLRQLAGAGWGSAGEPTAVQLMAGMLTLYTRLLLVPWPLNSWYTAAQVKLQGLNAVCAFTFAMACLVTSGERFGRLGLKALVWTFAFIIPVLGFVPLNSAVIAERFLYIPSLGLTMVAACLLSVPAMSRSSGMARMAVLVVLSILATLTVLRAKTWESETAFFLAMTRSSPESAIGYDGLGTISQRSGDLEGALRHYRIALEKDPKASNVFDNLGNTLVKLGRREEAIAAYRAGLALSPDSPLLHFNMAFALDGLGRRVEGIKHYRESLRVDPDAPETMNNLAWVLVEEARSGGSGAQEAVSLAERANALTRNTDPLYMDTLAAAYAASGDLRAARETAARALELARSKGDRILEGEIIERLKGYGLDEVELDGPKAR